MHRSSLLRAKQKLQPEFFASALRQQCQKLADQALWKGHHVFAVDGTSLLLPATPQVLEVFPRERRGDHYPKAKLVTALNVFTGQPLWWTLEKSSASEKRVLLDQRDSFPANSIMLLDRGFDAEYLWQELSHHHQGFIVRLRVSTLAARKLLASGRKELRTAYPAGQLRVIRGGSKAQPFILITNLNDGKKYKRRELIDLYKKRWEVETAFCRAKQHLHIQNWGSKTLHGVQLEIASHLLMLSLIAGRVFQATRRLKNALLRVNFKNVVFIFRSALFCRLREGEIRAAILRVLRTHQSDRSYPRYSRQPTNKWINLRRPSWRKKQRYSPERRFS